MLDVATDIYHPSLRTVTVQLVSRELVRKAHAFAGTARTLDDSSELSDLMIELVTVRQTTDVLELVQLAGRLTDIPDNKEARAIHTLRRQAGCFVLFCATVLEVFDDHLSANRMKGIEDLALARQQMAIDAQLAWRLLASFRMSAGLSEPG